MIRDAPLGFGFLGDQPVDPCAEGVHEQFGRLYSHLPFAFFPEILDGQFDVEFPLQRENDVEKIDRVELEILDEVFVVDYTIKP